MTQLSTFFDRNSDDYVLDRFIYFALIKDSTTYSFIQNDREQQNDPIENNQNESTC